MFSLYLLDHTDSFRRNAIPTSILPRSRRSSSLSNPSTSLNRIEPNTQKENSSKPTDTILQLPGISRKLREVLRHIPQSVVILTAPIRQETSDSRLSGMTLSTFHTVTLSPEPIISFSIKHPSRTLQALKDLPHEGEVDTKWHQEQRYFQIHLLQGNNAGAEIAEYFAKYGGPISKDGHDLLFTPDDKLGKGVRRVLHCEILHQGRGAFIDVGDHTMVFGKVKKINVKNPSMKTNERPWKGLCYMLGEYQSHITMPRPPKKTGYMLGDFPKYMSLEIPAEVEGAAMQEDYYGEDREIEDSSMMKENEGLDSKKT